LIYGTVFFTFCLMCAFSCFLFWSEFIEHFPKVAILAINMCSEIYRTSYMVQVGCLYLCLSLRECPHFASREQYWNRRFFKNHVPVIYLELMKLQSTS
jgi:hypothetical protein